MEKLTISRDSVIASAKEVALTAQLSVDAMKQGMGAEGSASPSFPISVFPEAIRNIAQSYILKAGFNHDFLCACILSVFAEAMGNIWTARFCQTLSLTPILYVVLIGPPSSGKTPPLNEVCSPLRRMDRESDIRYNKEREEYDRLRQMDRRERRERGLEEFPVCPRHSEFIADNTTIEQLITVLSHNPHGVMMTVNELDGLVSNMSRYSKGSDEAFWIELFDGHQVKYERKMSDEYVNLMHPFVSILGGTQPALLGRMFGGERMGSGFTSRFLKVFPSITSMPCWRSGGIPPDIFQKWESIIRGVATTSVEHDDAGEIISREVTFSDEAMAVLIDWEKRIMTVWEDADSYMQGVCGKLKTYVIRFCLILHVMRLATGRLEEHISGKTAEGACLLADYFFQMDERVHNVVSKKPADRVHQLFLDRLPETFTTAQAVEAGLSSGLSERTVKRFLRDGIGSYLKKERHGEYSKA